ncbi:uncharacterized protein LOC111276663 [Durio zibethinus]|uniref:Uncharacterized protein LOC111276663 n=1 Tax=Durio zibethinus TaxID=66656 RepID=A0A6P5WQ55_DURZI|nr:uncharacterized protein LOC111276663 [Durio zibethinus]
MSTSLTLLTPNTNNTTAEAMEAKAKPAMEFVKSNKGRKPNGRGPYQKKQPQRGMGVAQLERLRKMTETRTPTTTTQFPSEPIGNTSNVPVLHGVANYGVPMMMNGGGSGGLWGWGTDTAGFVMQRIVGIGGFGGLNGQVLVGSAPGNVQVGCGGAGVAEASKWKSSTPKLQHSKPDRCDVCFKKKRRNGENAKFNRGFNQFGQVLPIKRADFLGYNLGNTQNINEEMINGFSTRAASSASTYAGQMNNINETVDAVAIHRKGKSIGTGSFLMEYEFFPGESSRSTSSKKWELPAEASVAMGGEASYADASNCVDLSLKLSY